MKKKTNDSLNQALREGLTNRPKLKSSNHPHNMPVLTQQVSIDKVYQAEVFEEIILNWGS